MPFLAAAAVSSTYGGCPTDGRLLVTGGSLFGTRSGGFGLTTIADRTNGSNIEQCDQKVWDCSIQINPPPGNWRFSRRLF
jgi:hypothetical protein